MGLFPVLAVGFQRAVLLKILHRQLRRAAELAVRTPFAQIIAQLDEVLLELLHVRAGAPALQQAIAQRRFLLPILLRRRDQRRMRLLPILAVRVQPLVLLERLHRQLRRVAELAVRTPFAQIIAQSDEVLLELLYIPAGAAVLQQPLAQRVVLGLHRALVPRAVVQHHHRVAVGLGHEDVALAQIRALVGVLRPAQLHKRARRHQIRGHVPRPEIAGQPHDARVGAAHAHQRRTVRLAVGPDLSAVKAHRLGRLVQRVALPLVVADVAVFARRLHVRRDLQRLFALDRPEHPPALAMQIPLLRAQLAPGLVARPAAVGLAPLVDSRTSHSYRRHVSSILSHFGVPAAIQLTRGTRSVVSPL